MNDQPVWDAHQRWQSLQDAVLAHDRDQIAAHVSDQMMWVLPVTDNTRGKQAWIDASCAISWNWFDIRIVREIDLGDTRIVEAWVRQQRHATTDEVAQGTQGPITAEGAVLDVWTVEDGTWRLICRHPQRAQS
jgi:hypothetical protein